MLTLRLRNKLIHWPDPVPSAALYIDPAAVILPAGGGNFPDAFGTTSASGEATLNLAGLTAGDHVLLISPPQTSTGDVGTSTATGPDTARIFRPAWIQFNLDGKKNVTRANVHPNSTQYATLTTQLANTKNQIIDVRLQPIWIKSPYKDERHGQAIDMIMVHKTGGEVIGPAINQFLSGGSSSHYMIDRDGQIVKFVKDTIAAGHASHENNEDQSHWGSQTKLAYRSIGIENVGSDAQALTDAQYTSLIRLIQELMSAYNVPRHRVIGHGDCLTDGNAVLSDQRIECPGPLFEWDRLETANPPIGLARTGGTSSGADPVAAFFKTMTDKGVANLALTGGDFDPQPGAGKPSKFGHKDYKDITDTPIKTLQTWLAEIGYSVGTADGKLNPRTVQAARHFQVHFQNRDNVATINAETAALIKAVRDANPKAD